MYICVDSTKSARSIASDVKDDTSIAQQLGSNIWHESKQKERERSRFSGLSCRNTANIQ
jgi:hypothetical protein